MIPAKPRSSFQGGTRFLTKGQEQEPPPLGVAATPWTCVYVVRGARYVKDVESLLLRIVKPKGALVSGRFRGAENLKKSLLPRLERYADALTELKAR